MKKTIIVFSCENDEHSEQVIEHINQNLYNVLVLEREKYGTSWSITCIVRDDKTIGITIETQNQEIHQNEINSIYLRRDFTIESQDIKGDYTVSEKEYISTQRSIHVNSCIKLLASIIPTINTPEANYRSLSKILQLHLALKVGLKVPQSFFGGKINNDQFLLRKDDVCIKPLEGIHLKQDNKTYAHYAELLQDKSNEALSTLVFCPAIIQEYISKIYELRITIVGDKIFSCMIDSQKSELGKIDWRHHDWANTPHYAVSIPAEIEYKLNNLMKQLGLVYGAIDMIFDGKDYYFLEVNSMGQWLWIEDFTGMPISKEIAMLLSIDNTNRINNKEQLYFNS